MTMPAATTMSPPPAIEVFYDGGCPACRREIAMLARRDRHGIVAFTDIAAEDFEPGAHERTREEFMAAMHARLPDGRYVKGVEAFRQLYAALGWRRLVAFTRWPVVAPILDRVYALWARHRLRLQGCDEGQGCATN